MAGHSYRVRKNPATDPTFSCVNTHTHTHTHTHMVSNKMF